MKIAFTTIHYPVAMGRYFWEALLRRDDVEVWAAGPFTNTWIPWAYGMNLPESYVRRPDFEMPFNAPPTINYPEIEESVPWVPDVWIEVNAGLNVINRPRRGKYVVVGSDPHVLDYSWARANADMFFCMQAPYMRAGDLWLPYAYDPIWHCKSVIPFAERAYDASLIGLQYPMRIELFRILKAHGHTTFFELGKAYEDARSIYHSTKVGLNWSSRQDLTARVFELIGMGCVPIVNRVPDLMALFKEGQNFLGFSTLDEAIDKVNFALARPKYSEEIIKYNAGIKGHTWDDRVDEMISAIKKRLKIR